MKTAFIAIAAFVAAALAIPQGVTESIKPDGSNPAGCMASYNGEFEVTISDSKAKRDVAHLEKRDCAKSGALVVTLRDGILKDAQGRTGYIASNYQFQFDAPAQSGAIITAGYSVCANGSLALGPSTVFYKCLSGDFSNLYDRHWAAQCSPVHMNVIPCGGGASVAQKPDGQVVGTTMVATTIVSVLADGQPQALPTQVAVPLCQIGDGQIQAHTTPCAEVPIPTASGAPVSQIPDGQIQVPTGAPVSQIPDGQVQVPAATAAGNATAGGAKPTPSSPPPATQANIGVQKMIPASVVALILGFAGLLAL